MGPDLSQVENLDLRPTGGGEQGKRISLEESDLHFKNTALLVALEDGLGGGGGLLVRRLGSEGACLHSGKGPVMARDLEYGRSTVDGFRPASAREVKDR